jgi:hypothetical protein
MKAPCIFALLAVLPVTLSAQKVTTEFDEEHDFSDYKTFAIQDGKIHSKNPSLNNDLVLKKVDGLIRKRLTARGLTESASQPDLNVVWSLGSGERKQVERYSRGWHGSRTVAYHYTEGTLILKLRDARKQDLVWQAIAVEDKNDPMKIQAALDDMVRKSFDKYPPKKDTRR